MRCKDFFVFQKISVSLQALSREDGEVKIIELITNLKHLYKWL